MLSRYFLVGPTAVGKTSLAIEIARRSGAEILNADPFQVYRGLDILTAKPTADELGQVPHHLIGTLPLEAEYNVARFLADARQCLGEIAARGKPAIIVGGSGLYIKALTHGLSPLPPAPPELRAELAQMELGALLTRLHTLDPAAIQTVDPKNPRRVIRAIEICEMTGKPLAAARTTWQHSLPATPIHGLFLTRQKPDLQARIAARVAAMIPAGLLAEVQGQMSTAFSLTSAKIIGLADVCAHLRGQVDLASCLASIDLATRHYAKRQLTWFRAQPGFTPVDLTAIDRETAVAGAVRSILHDEPSEQAPPPLPQRSL